MASIGSFCLVKNEIRWIEAHLKSWLPHLDQICIFDGNSTDGTLEVLNSFRAENPSKIIVVEDKDPKNLQDDYVRVFNECLHTLETDYAIFAHPDMILDDPGQIGNLGDGIAYSCEMRSFGGEPDGQLFEIVSGRNDRWKNIYRLKNPDLGLHYFGHYGAWNEDCYFSKITKTQHVYHADFELYPYEVKKSGIRISHFSDVRPLARRISRMAKCLINDDPGMPMAKAKEISANHPRVTFRNENGFQFVPCDYPESLKRTTNV
jgi:glycosyltransferase involved in cell wall biosynthesis